MAYIERFVEKQLWEALEDTPVVVIVGPRQSGKSTLAQHIADKHWSYLTLDDSNVLNAALDDPTGLLKQTKKRVIIDEIQRAPDILRSIKLIVDRDRQPGRFLITGSADVLAMPRTSESLAGRSEFIPLLPLSQTEIHNRAPRLIEAAFGGDVPQPGETPDDAELITRILKGGFPEVIKRNRLQRQQQWCRAYLEAIVQRDIREIADIRKAWELPRLFSALASYSGKLVNLQELSQKIKLDGKTVNSYIAAFEQLFLIHRLSAWHNNTLKRLVKTPKLYFTDTALLASMIEANPALIKQDRRVLGPLLETFVFTELQKQISWQDRRITLTHYRDKDKVEVDFVLENSRSQVVGIEVKAASTVHGRDFRGLRKLAHITGKHFCLGIVFYTGEHLLPFGERQFAAPVNCLWS